MKQKTRIRTVVFLAAIYCYAIGIVSGTNLHDKFEGKLNHDTESYFSLLSSGLFTHNAAPENTLNNFNTLSKLGLNKTFNSQWVVNRNNEQLYEDEYFLLSHHSIDYLLNSRKSDLLYPFHHFW